MRSNIFHREKKIYPRQQIGDTNSISMRHYFRPSTVIFYRKRSQNVDLHNNGLNSANLRFLPIPVHTLFSLDLSRYAHECILCIAKNRYTHRTSPWIELEKTNQ